MIKKILLLFCVLFSYETFSQTSIYHSFADSNAVWNYNYTMNCFQNGQGDEDYSIQLFGDTTINSLDYTILNIPYIESRTTGTCHWNNSGYKGSIREDISNRKVYYVPPNENMEQLLYDFNLEAGDTIKGFLSSRLSNNYDTIVEIDSVLVGNTYRKRWKTSSCYDFNIIEGIGSTYGLIEPSPQCFTDMPSFNLLCYKQNGQTLFSSTNSNCDLITYVPSIKEVNKYVATYPNPAMESAIIETSYFNESEVVSFELTDINGNVIARKEFKASSKMIRERISLSAYPSGTYFYQLKGEDGKIIAGKILKK